MESCAKINIGLKITGQRSDGYHTLQTVFHEIPLFDTLTLEKESSGCTLTSDDPSLPADESNLCVQALNALVAEHAGIGGVKIHLEKRIPVGAGLGGGSSNAAAVLKGTNDLYNLGLSIDELEGTAAPIGADVPFFVRGGTQYAEGIGDVLTPVSLPPMGATLLVTAPVQISTAWAYGKLNNHLAGKFTTGKFAAALESFDSWTSANEFLENDFEPLVFRTYPEIGEIKNQLLENGARFASLSGSGSTVFGIFTEETEALEAGKQFSPPIQTFLTSPINR